MRILVAVDQHPYSAHVVKDVAKLAGNTWADVTLLGVGAKATDIGRSSNRAGIKHPLTEKLRNYRRNFLGHLLMKNGRVPMNSSRLKKEYGKSCTYAGEPGKI